MGRSKLIRHHFGGTESVLKQTLRSLKFSERSDAPPGGGRRRAPLGAVDSRPDATPPHSGAGPIASQVGHAPARIGVPSPTSAKGHNLPWTGLFETSANRR
jgi:hypothetical protein